MRWARMPAIFLPALFLSGLCANKDYTSDEPPPLRINKCQKQAISWSGGLPPYRIRIQGPSNGSRELIAQTQSKTVVIDSLNVRNGAVIKFVVTDSTGQAESSKALTVQTSGNGCLMLSAANIAQTRPSALLQSTNPAPSRVPFTSAKSTSNSIASQTSSTSSAIPSTTPPSQPSSTSSAVPSTTSPSQSSSTLRAIPSATSPSASRSATGSKKLAAVWKAFAGLLPSAVIIGLLAWYFVRRNRKAREKPPVLEDGINPNIQSLPKQPRRGSPISFLPDMAEGTLDRSMFPFLGKRFSTPLNPTKPPVATRPFPRWI